MSVGAAEKIGVLWGLAQGHQGALPDERFEVKRAAGFEALLAGVGTDADSPDILWADADKADPSSLFALLAEHGGLFLVLEGECEPPPGAEGERVVCLEPGGGVRWDVTVSMGTVFRIGTGSSGRIAVRSTYYDDDLAEQFHQIIALDENGSIEWEVDLPDYHYY